jgi:Mitochondrial carrier protein
VVTVHRSAQCCKIYFKSIRHPVSLTLFSEFPSHGQKSDVSQASRNTTDSAVELNDCNVPSLTSQTEHLLIVQTKRRPLQYLKYYTSTIKQMTSRRIPKPKPTMAVVTTMMVSRRNTSSSTSSARLLLSFIITTTAAVFVGVVDILGICIVDIGGGRRSPSTLPVFVSAFSIDPILHFGAGAVAGGVGAVAAYPFDYVKSQLQTPYGKERWGPGGTKTAEGESVGGGGAGGGGLQCAWDTLVEYGPQRFYKGVTIQVLGIAPEKGIKLGVNDVLKHICLGEFGGHFPLWAQIIAGATAGACQTTASSPLEVMKVGLQTSNKTIAQVWNDIGGAQGLYRGADACLVRDVVWTAVCFPLYAYWVDDCSISTFVAGAMSGVIASFITTPADVVKTRILSQDERSVRQREAMTMVTEFHVDLEPTIQDSGIVELSSVMNVVETNPNHGEIALGGSAGTILSPVLTTSTALAAVNSTSSSWTDVYANQEFINMDEQDSPAIEKSLSSSSSSTELVQSRHIVGGSDDKNYHFIPTFMSILQAEGASVLFSGATERCIGAIPRFGTTLALHDYLEHYMDKAGWFS